MKYRFTKHQVARGSRADAERHNTLFLVKNVTFLRLTYQIKLLTFRAFESKLKLVIQIPSKCKLHDALRDYQREHSKVMQIVKV